MRILHILNSPGGGATIGALELIRTSREAESPLKHFSVYPGVGTPHPDVAAVCHDARPLPMRWWNSKIKLSMLPRVAAWAREMQLTGFQRKTRGLIRQLVDEWSIDVIHSNTAAIDDGAVVAAQLGLPHVWHIRERIGREGFMRFPLSDSALSTRITSLSDAVVPMSRFVGEIFIEHGQGEKVKVVYDGVDRQIFDTDEARAKGYALRRSWGIPDDAVLVGKVAAVTSMVKRHEVFIRAAGILAKKNRSVRFAIIGPVPQQTSWVNRHSVEYFDGLKRLVKSEGLEDRFVFTGNVTDAGAMMNSIDVLAHACDLEGFGRVAIEAMAAGKPVAGPAAGGFTESVVEGETGRLVTPGDANSLSAALEEISGSEEVRTKFGSAAREWVRANFSPEKHLEEMSRVYESVAANKKVVASSIEEVRV